MGQCVVCNGNNSERMFEKNNHIVVKCVFDGHIYVSNPPSPEVLSALYSQEYFEGTANMGYRHNVFQNRKKQEQKAKRKLKRVQQFVSRGKLLDVGCGPGYFLREASRFFQSEGSDISEAAANFARDTFGLEIKVGDFLEQQNESVYDVITMFSFLEHTLDPRRNLEKVRSLLKSRGWLVLALPNINGIGRYVRGINWRGFEIPEHLHFFHEQNLRTLLAETGFSPIPSKYKDNNFFRDTNYFYARKK